MNRHARLALMLFATWLSSVAMPACDAVAHEIRPAIVTLSFPDARRFEIDIKVNIEALIAKIGPVHKDTDESPDADTYRALRALPSDELAKRFMAAFPDWQSAITLSFDGRRADLVLADQSIPDVANLSLARISTVRLSGAVPDAAGTFVWAYDARYGSSVLRTQGKDGKAVAVGWLKDGLESSPTAILGAAPKSSPQHFFEYVRLGFTHILPLGADHILFVLALYFLSPGWRPLLMQVTAFTVAHSITLALGLYGVVAIAPSIVEPLIAASIVLVAVENLATSRLSRWRPALVFAFGLLHGLGFASVLHEIGMPKQDYVVGLIGFNLGVELGQLAVIAIAFSVTGFWFARQSWYRMRVTFPASLIIAAIGVYWTIERVVYGA